MCNKKSWERKPETRMQDIPAETKKRAPSSRVLQEVIRQAPAEYVTVGWLTSTLHRHSFGIIMLSLGLLATTPVGSTVPGFILAVMAVQLIVGHAEPVFPHFIMTRRLPTKQLRRIGGRAIHVLKYLEKVVHPRTACAPALAIRPRPALAYRRRLLGGSPSQAGTCAAVRSLPAA
jgi:hypothetical protein